MIGNKDKQFSYITKILHRTKSPVAYCSVHCHALAFVWCLGAL